MFLIFDNRMDGKNKLHMFYDGEKLHHLSFGPRAPHGEIYPWSDDLFSHILWIYFILLLWYNFKEHREAQGLQSRLISRFNRTWDRLWPSCVEISSEHVPTTRDRPSRGGDDDGGGHWSIHSHDDYSGCGERDCGGCAAGWRSSHAAAAADAGDSVVAWSDSTTSMKTTSRARSSACSATSGCWWEVWPRG